MTDSRTRIPLSKPVDLAQLAAEVGAALSASDTELVVADPASKVTAAQLRAAVDAHTPGPPAPSIIDRLAAVEARLDKAASATVTGEAAKLRDNLKPST